MIIDNSQIIIEAISELFTFITIGISMSMIAGLITWGITAVCRVIKNIFMEGVRR